MSQHRPTEVFEPGFVVPSKFSFAVVAARFNAHIVDELLLGTMAGFAARGVKEKRVAIHYVPGAWELPVAARWLADTKRVDAIIVLGAVVRGETPHFDYVAGEASWGSMNVSVTSGKPVVFGVLTTDNEAQAWARASRTDMNKGRDFADAAIEMALLHGKISSKKKGRE